MNGLSYHSRVPLERLEIAPGSRILDVGCGCGCGWGDTSIALARRTGPEGEVLGLDSSWRTPGAAPRRRASTT
ncbi:hypothetical protein ACFQH5_11410 [Halomonas salifodinae]|uniref:Methyltransferase domain-containing protein n=1 Tax=Halomonas salifodinae TaxID=438745 RepID=A0ABW2EZK9_9GAMM